MTNTTTSSGVGVVSLASKLVRFLLILPLVALLQPGDNSWGCIAFQNHLTRKGYPRTDHFRFDQQPVATSTERRLPKDASLGAFTSNTYHFWSNIHKHRRSTSRMAAKETEDEDDDIAKVESKRVKAEAEAKRLMKEAQKAAKLKAEQDEKLKEAQEMLAALQAEAETRKKAEAEATKQQAEAEEKRKQAEEEAAKLKARAEEKKRLKAQEKAEEEAAKKKAEEEEEKKRLKAQKKAEEEAAKKKAEAEEKKKAEELATLLKAKEEAARVMAEIDAKLQAQTADADKEEAERVQKLQSEADQMLDLDDESDSMLKKMMEEMEKVSKELELRLMAEAEEAESKFKAEEEAAKMKKAKEEAAAKAKAEKEEKEEKESDKKADLMDRIKSGASFEPAAKTVAAENVKEIPFYSKPKEADEIIDTTATASKTAEKQKPMPMPDLSPSSKKKPEAKKPEAKKKAPEKPKWMKDWKQDEKPKAGKDTVEAKKDEKAKEEPAKDEPEKKISDPRTKGRSRKENLFDVIGRTATGGVTMDEITKRKQQKPEGTSKRPSPKVLSELKKKGPPSSFGESVAASYKTGQSENQGQRRPMPDLQNMKELKKKGPPASFGSFAQAASSKGSSPTASDNDTIDTLDKGPPASFGASVAMASSGEVPKDLLSRGTASTDAGASPPPQTPSSPSRKRGPDSNIIDVVDVEYTKKDDLTKKKDPIMGSAPPLEVEKTVPQAPPLQVEKTVPPMKNSPKKEDKKAPVAEAKGSSTANSVKNIGKAVVDNVFGKKKPEAEKDAEPKTSTKATDDGEVGEKAMEDRVAELLKEAFSLSKEDSRVADLLQGVVAITTGKDDKKKKKKKEVKTSAKKASAKGRKRARQVAAEEEIEEEEDLDDDEIDEDEDDYDEDEDDYDEDEDDYDDEEDDEEDLDDEYDEEEEEDTVIMGRGIGRNRRMEDRNDFRRDPNRRGPPNAGMGNRWGGGGRFDDGEYFVDDDNEYMEYDENDRWQGKGPGSGRPEPGGYSVRPPPSSQSRDRQGYETDDDYYFLQFGSPGGPSSRYDEPRGSRYDEPRGDRYYDDRDGYYYDDEYDGPQPGAPRPAYSEPEEEVPKGPPSSFGNFVADASMSKTGYAPTTLKDEKVGGSGINGNGSSSGQDEWGEEMGQGTGGMMSPRGVNGSGKGGGQARPSQPFVVSEDQSGGGRGRKKGPPASFGNSVASAGEQQTGNPSRSIEEEIANGGMATPTGGMATPRRKTPANPASGAGGGAAQGTGKKPLFVVSEEEAGPADFGSSVAEASGARTGWAPKAPKQPSGGLEGGTTGGMRPKIKKKPSPQNPETQKKAFGDSVFDDCPPVESKRKSKSEAEKPLSRKQQIGTNPNQKHSRNPAVNLVDGGASKEPKRPVQFSGSMMAPRIRRKAPPQPDETEDEGKAQ